MDNLRIRPLKSIRKKEDYEEYQKSMERYLTEYRWFTGKTPPPTEVDLQEKAKDEDLTPDAKDALNNRAFLVHNGKYLDVIKQNITAYLLAITEYEAKEEGVTVRDIVVGLLSKNRNPEKYSKIKDYLDRRYMKTKAERAGFVTTSVQNPGILSADDCLKQTIEQCDFINLEPILEEEVPTTAMVPVNEKQKELFDQVVSLFDAYIEKNGVKAKQTDARKQGQEVAPEEHAQRLREVGGKNLNNNANRTDYKEGREE